MKALSKHFTDIQMITGGMFIILLASASLIGIKDEEQVDSWRFVIVIFLVYAIGYPIGHTAVIGLFSKSRLNHYFLNQFFDLFLCTAF